MKIEKILACVVAGLFILCAIVYFTLPEQGEQIYIPGTQSVPEYFSPVEIMMPLKLYWEREKGRISFV